jgi:hypothetical protein
LLLLCSRRLRLRRFCCCLPPPLLLSDAVPAAPSLLLSRLRLRWRFDFLLLFFRLCLLLRRLCLLWLRRGSWPSPSLLLPLSVALSSAAAALP